MSSLSNKITVQRVFIWMVTIIGICLAPVLGYFTCTMGWELDIIVAALIAVAAWAFIARDRWWVPFPAALSLGGTFYFGFKIPVHEMALLICLFPLALAMATRWQGAISGRSYPPPSVFLLALYLFLHWIGSLIFNGIEGLGGIGNVTRSYMNAIWPMILFFSYYFFGTSRYARMSLFLMYCALLFRVITSALSYWFPAFVYIPGINFIPTAASIGENGGATDLRTAAPMLAMLSICYFQLLKGSLRRIFHLIVVIGCFPLTLLGAGRLGLVGYFLLILFALVIHRKFTLISVFCGFMIILVGLINSDPSIIEPLPPLIKRSASGLIFNKTYDSTQTELSDEWHFQLQKIGRERWLSTLPSIMIGNGFRPFNMEEFSTRDFNAMVQVANATCRYESALWTVLASIGLVGMLLYLNVFRFLLSDSLPVLWKGGICNTETAYAFITAYQIFIWLFMGYFSGAFPSTEIMMGLFAKTLHDDQRKREEAEQNRESADIEESLPRPT